MSGLSSSIPPAASSDRRSPARFVGIDFGTTNSVVAVADPDRAEPARVARYGAARDDASFRSLLCLWPDDDGPPGTIRAAAGPDAIEAFRTHGADSRLIQSVKSFVASPGFESTVMFGQRYTIVDLITLLLRGLRRGAELSVGPLGPAAWCGRPVRFVGQQADEALALRRLEQAYARVGFASVTFIPEPQAAAHHYARSVRGTQVCLVADFGGGTSDFTLLRVTGAGGADADADAGATPAIDVIAQAGVGIAGDAFDQRIVEHVVSPLLGLGSTYRGMSGQALAVPGHYYESLSAWHRLSMMRTRQTLKELQDIRVTAADPQAIERFMYLLDNELGFELHAAVTEAKAQLSRAESATLRLRAGPIDIEAALARADFERWIAPELRTLAGCVDAMLADADLPPGRVDRVFLTGGSSLIPAVRDLFATRFGAQRLSSGDEFFSIAAGLALAARESGSAAAA
ncbi:MAG: Hsp70 family protein [Burkholderiaceae bacterium]